LHCDATEESEPKKQHYEDQTCHIEEPVSGTISATNNVAPCYKLHPAMFDFPNVYFSILDNAKSRNL
jgi:hypothetical protein